MHVILVCDNDVLRRSIINAVLEAGHTVLTVTTEPRAADTWPAQVESRVAAADDVAALQDAVRGCAAAIVVDGSVSQRGTAQNGDLPAALLTVLAGLNMPKVVHVTSAAGMDRPAGSSIAPGQVRTGWLVLYTTAVYGITDDVVTQLLIMMRSLPAAPTMSETYRLRPLWHEDLAAAVTAAVARPACDAAAALRIAGPDTVSPQQLYDRIAALIDRRPPRIPLPDFVVDHGAAWRLPVFSSAAWNAEAAPGPSMEDLTTTLGLTPTSLDDGLRRLITDLPEVTPAGAVGGIEVKRFWTTIRGSQHDAAGLLLLFRTRFGAMMPIDVGVEPAAAEAVLKERAVITMALPGRGHVQVRVEQVADDRVVVATLHGHAVAGIVQFSTRDLAGGVGFEVMTCDGAGSALDWLALTFGGARGQDANWTEVVRNAVTLSGGTADGPVQHDVRKLSSQEAAVADGWIQRLIQPRRPDDSEPEPQPSILEPFACASDVARGSRR